MKKRRKQLSLLLATVMCMGLMPPYVAEAQTEVTEATEPGVTQFATAEQLKGFDTNDTNGQNPAKVYFGQDKNGKPQTWWIAGSQDAGSLVLFAASPLATGTQFHNTTAYGQYEGQQVFANHYGASDIRNGNQAVNPENPGLSGLLDSCFTSEEKGLMNDTTVYTSDAKNGETYFTTDKLYLAHGDWSDDQYITVGKNSSRDLKSGLRVDKAYWGNAGRFWLRAPDPDRDFNALVAWPGRCVLGGTVSDPLAVVPAFEFNLSSVIFASAAPAASSDGNLTVEKVNEVNQEGAFTLRYQSDSIGDATVSATKESVSISGVSTSTGVDTYLVAQNSEGAWAKKVEQENDIIFANEMDSSLTSFDKCKVWLETTNGTTRITSAKAAIQSTTQGSYNVKITPGEHMSITGGNGRQTGVSGQISEITVTAENGYCFPESCSVTLNGVSVERTSDTTLKISGTPTADTLIRLPHVHNWTYQLKSSSPDTIEAVCNGAGTCELTDRKGGSVTLTAPQGDMTYDGNAKEASLTDGFTTGLDLPANGEIDITYAKKNQDGQYTNIFGMPMDAGDYKASITLGNDVTASVEFTINPKEIGITWSDTALIYNGTEQAPAATAAEGSLVSGDTCSITVTGAQINAGDYTATAAGVSNSNYKLPVANKTVEFTIEKQTVASPMIESKVYTGGALSSDMVDTELYTVEQNESGTDAGKYNVSLKLKDTANYKWEESETSDTISLEFEIKAAALTGVSVKQIGSLTYNGKEQTARVEAEAVSVNDQPVTFSYSKEQDGAYTEDVPAFTEAGEHTVYYKAAAKNHEVYTGNFKVRISEAAGGNAGSSRGGENVDAGNGGVQTGDDSHLVLWIVLMAASLAGAGTTVLCRRKKRIR